MGGTALNKLIFDFPVIYSEDIDLVQLKLAIRNILKFAKYVANIFLNEKIWLKIRVKTKYGVNCMI